MQWETWPLFSPSGLFCGTGLCVAAGYFLFETALAVWDAYDTASTVFDSCASGEEKLLAGGLFIAGAILPGGGYSKLDDLYDVTKRVTREQRWLELAKQPNSRLPKEVIDHINRHGGKGVTARFGQDLAHQPKRPAAQGYDYSEALPKTLADHHGIQHRYLKERRTGTTISMPKKKRGNGKLSLPPKGRLP